MNLVSQSRLFFQYCLCLFAFLGSHNSKALSKNTAVDSLTLREDTVHVNLLLRQAENAVKLGAYDEALRQSQQARRLALRLSFADGIGCSWLTSGQAYYRKNEPDSATSHLRKALAVFTAINDLKHQGIALLEMGQVLNYQARYEDALRHYHDALSRFITIQNKLLIAQARNYTANTHFNQGKYEIALDQYLKSYRIGYDVVSGKPAYFSPLNNIGVVYALFGQYDEALKYFLMYHEVIKDQPEKKHARSSVLLNIGECYSELHEPVKAQQFLKEAVSLQQELGDRRGLALSFSNLAETHRKQKKIKQAGEYYHDAIRLARAIKNQEVLLHPLNGVSRLYLEQGNFTGAKAAIDEALRISIQIRSKVWEEKTLLIASRFDSARGNITNAYRLFQQYHALHDSLFNERRSRQVTEIRELYEAEKKQQEINLLTEAKKFEELKRKNDRTWYLVYLSLLAFFVIAAAYWAISKTRNSKILKKQKDTIAEANQKLQKLLDKIEHQNKALANKNEILEELHREKDGLIGIVAHDLRSPLTQITGLSTLVELSGELNPDQKELIKNMKTVCTNGNALIQDLLDINQFETTKKLDRVPLEVTQFLPTVFENYMPAIRKKELTLHYEYDRTKRAVLVTDQECIVRIVDNLLTNAIKFSPPGLDIFVRLDMSDENRLILSIQDQGPGFTQNDKAFLFKKFKKLSARPTGGEPSTGLGLSIVKSLVDRLEGAIEVISQHGKGAEIRLSFAARIYHRASEPVI